MDSGLWGTIFGILAYTAWGVLPLYWKLLDRIPALEILAHRVFWSFLFLSLIILVSKQLPSLIMACKKKRTMFYVFLSAIIISLNWFTFIWAVTSGRVVEASMGYYINPLIVVLLGTVVLKEQLNTRQKTAILFASVGVIIMTVQYGGIPWVALTLALSFACYGLIKKTVDISSLNGLTLETAMTAPIALGYILYIKLNGTGSLEVIPLPTMLTLFASGIATATPLLLFAQAAKSIKFSTMGFMQYIAPSLSLAIGVFLFHEPFTKAHLLSFSFIWIALIIYSLSHLSIKKARQNVLGEKL